MDDGRRRFMFGREKNTTEPSTHQRKTQISTKEVTRRQFAKDSAKVAAASLVLGAGLLKNERAEAAYSPEEEKKMSIMKFCREVCDFVDKNFHIDKTSYSLKEITISDRDDLHAKLVAKYGGVLAGTFCEILHLTQTKDTDYWNSLDLGDQTLTDFEFGRNCANLIMSVKKADCSGYIHQALLDQGLYKDRHDEEKIKLPMLRVQPRDNFFVRAADFLPTSDEIEKTDIDPRTNPPTNVSHVENLIDEYPEWTTDVRQNKFKKKLDPENKKVLELFRKSDCTLAEVYSMIKAVIKFREDHPTCRLEDHVILEFLFNEREIINDREILSPQTDSFIYFLGPTANIKKTEELYKEISLKTMRQKKEDGRMETDKEVLDRVYGLSVDRDGESAGEKLLSHIKDSRGKTAVFINTHGSPDRLQINDEKDLRAEDLAEAFMERLKFTKNPTDLEQVTLFVGACLSYDFTKKLIDSMKRKYVDYISVQTNQTNAPDTAKKLPMSFQGLSLPTIITSSQVGSLSYGAENIELKENITTIEKEGKLTGELFMRRIQPASYVHNDMTFFSGRSGGLLEVAMNESQKNGVAKTKTT